MLYLLGYVDISLGSIISPPLTIYQGETYIPAVEVENLGNETSPSFKVYLKVKYGEEIIVEEYKTAPPLLPSQKITLSFSPFTPLLVGNYIFEFSTDTSGDINPENNYKSVFCGCQIGLLVEESGIYDGIRVVRGGIMLNNRYAHIYSISGETVFKGKSKFVALKRGFYFLKVGGKTLKILIR